MRMRHFLLNCLMLMLPVWAHGAALSGNEIARNMQATRLSNGFSARMNVAVIEANGKRQEPFKLSIIGQLNSEHRRLLLRGVSPAGIQHKRIVAEIKNGKIVAATYAEAPETPIADFAEDQDIFDSGLRLWDMFAPWWDWREQKVIGTADIRGVSCIRVRSAENAVAAHARSVVSCIDTSRKISLRTEIWGPDNKLMRTIEVLSTQRRNSGTIVAKKVQLKNYSGRITESEVYSGDENYEVSDVMFSRLGALENK